VISFVVPAHNEEPLLPATLQAIHAAAQALGERYEIVVVDDDSTDATATVAAAAGAHVLKVQRRHIAAVRNAGARTARGDVLVFVDADTIVTTELLRDALAALQTGVVGGGCRLAFDGQVPFYARFMQAVFMPMFRLLGWACGCFVFCRQADFHAVGGFDERFYGGEEVALSRAMRHRGKFVVLPRAVVSSGRKMRTHSAWEVLKPFVAVFFRGDRALQSRRGLELWYGPRRHEGPR
jgi:glycosyltransferase involved in cell wall biosynthesis